MDDAKKKRRVKKGEQDREGETKPVRLHVFLSRAGIASRRKCEEFIAAGLVTLLDVAVSRNLPKEEVA